MSEKSTFIENYKEYLFFLYYLGQIKRKKNLNLLKQTEFDNLLIETNRKLQFLFNLIKRTASDMNCAKCDKKINQDSFIICASCFNIFHENHLKKENIFFKCANCNSKLKKENILDKEIYISNNKDQSEKLDISKIEIIF